MPNLGPTDPFPGLHPIFRDVCDPRIKHYSLAIPFRSGEYVVSTDGMIIVRIPAAAIPEATLADIDATMSFRRVPRPSSVRMAFMPEFVFADSIDDLPITLPDPGPLDTTCPDCDGSGRRITQPDKAHQICEECEGLGWFLDYSGIELPDGRLFAKSYVHLLRRHHACCFPSISGPLALRFTIGDIEGMVMGISAREE